MKFLALVGCGVVFAASLVGQDSERDFSGVWKLNASVSEFRSMPIPASDVIKITQTSDSITCSTGCKYRLDGNETKFQLTGGFTSASRTKWEGRALMISSVVTGPQRFSLHDRWTLSRDHNTLRIRRQVVTLHGETESNLVYEREGALTTSAPSASTDSITAAVVSGRATMPIERSKKELTYALPAGTKIPLKLTKTVSTKTASEGDRVYLETAYPVIAEGRVLIPPGSAVTGTVTNVIRPGRVKGRGEFYLRFDSVVLPNGVTRDLRARPDRLEGDMNATLERSEGKIESQGAKASDAKKTGQAAATGAAVGSVAGSMGGRAGMGAGIGAAGGAAAGLTGVLMSRGADTVLERGSIIEMQTDRPLLFVESELLPN